MSHVRFYALNRKFLDSRDKIPEQAQQVMYYSLAIGHHVGVIDCLKQVLHCPLAEYEGWVGQLSDEEARRKMLGLLRFGEITIDHTHTALLGGAFTALAAADRYPEWTATLVDYLAAMQREPAIYLMVKRIDD
ncbi:formate hydrogenlyase maturation HycH family protein [Dickeya dadantii]|uniref:Predicted processing element hydrogenase 4 n=1 Tax=Dickeya dadantii (strain 3937) TaxID=198628 RepID=E0SHK4_DICD3|nr:formate hydrogenlyase maturation HycH family protein [Dickeya dadantii]ADM97769.1 predicted processing element hydrogenase 4 [Dickeya dadantii 3937]NAT78473.1 formate hydrogenlyase maturation protein HycH [Dickeya dadantii]NPE54130.1 HycH family protein [Dickeya dadantii]NPE64548.1 HycH family protein [Dickeya dadantii]NPE68438.1 HycH family protein [Dickeya dadantii]